MTTVDAILDEHLAEERRVAVRALLRRPLLRQFKQNVGIHDLAPASEPVVPAPCKVKRYRVQLVP